MTQGENINPYPRKQKIREGKFPIKEEEKAKIREGKFPIKEEEKVRKRERKFVGTWCISDEKLWGSMWSYSKIEAGCLIDCKKELS